MGVIIQSAMTIGASVLIAFIFGWKLTCVLMAFLPFLIASGLLQGRLYAGFSRGEKDYIEQGGKVGMAVGAGCVCAFVYCLFCLLRFAILIICPGNISSKVRSKWAPPCM